MTGVSKDAAHLLEELRAGNEGAVAQLLFSHIAKFAEWLFVICLAKVAATLRSLRSWSTRHLRLIESGIVGRLTVEETAQVLSSCPEVRLEYSQVVAYP